MEGSIPYIEIVPCKEEDPTNDEMNLRGRPMSEFMNVRIYLLIFTLIHERKLFTKMIKVCLHVFKRNKDVVNFMIVIDSAYN